MLAIASVCKQGGLPVLEQRPASSYLTAGVCKGGSSETPYGKQQMPCGHRHHNALLC